ncbi:2-dehydropantoate 2-reductase N-terminal domain-containing protein [Streptomyces sp. NPDC126510]|uniref:2-dehydropantoate 2-reductase N-terminal domain-containing protein n=1 Tax=Streptomyces sp. NPDC126510 TaxID=3155317 RepID=UPI00332AFB15
MAMKKVPGRWRQIPSGSTATSEKGGDMAKLCVVGAGVVGQATGKGFLKLGHDVTFVDVNADTVEQIRSNGFSAIFPEEIILRDVEAVFISVPTPTAEDGVNLSSLDQACHDIDSALAVFQSRPVIVFRSTILPGTTRKHLVPLLEKAAGDSRVGEHVCYNPEYLRERHAQRDFDCPRIITIGQSVRSEDAAHRLAELYHPFDAKVYRCGYEEAEFQKYVNNLFNAAKISFFNEMREMAKGLGIDPTLAFQLTVRSAQGMWDPLYGIHDKGVYGGACLPKDTNAWIEYMEESGFNPIFMQAVREINRSIGGA